MRHFGLKRKIRKAMKRARAEFTDSVPPIADHFFYGAVEIGPGNLAMWYLFAADVQLEQARESGLCGQIAEATIRHLEQLKYPANVRGCVYFASQETIDHTPGGPRMYFQ